MPKASPRTPELIDAEIAKAQQVADTAYATAKRWGGYLPVAWNSQLGMRADPEPAMRSHRAWAAAWEAQKALLLLQRERAVLNQTAHGEAAPPDEDVIEDLSRRLEEATRHMKTLRGELFRERQRQELYVQRTVDLSRKVVEFEQLLVGADREIAKQTELAAEAERVMIGRASLAQQAA